MTDVRSDIHTKVDETLDEAETESAKEQRIAQLENRVSVAEGGREPVDLSPINARIDDLAASITAIPEAIAAAVAGALATAAQSPPTTQHESEAKVEANPPEDVSEPVSVKTQIASATDFDERPPKVSHLLFRRFGRR